MAIYRVQGPDGAIYRFEGPDGATPEQVEAAAAQQFGSSQSQEEPKKMAGFGGSYMDAVQTLGLSDEAAAYAADPSDANRKKFLDAAKSKYDSVGGFGKGQDWEYFKELLGGSLGQMTAPLAAGAVGSLAGPIASGAAFAGVDAAQYSIQNLQRQAQEQQASIDQGRAPAKTDVGKALIAAVPQAGLDVAETAVFGGIFKHFPLMKGLIGGDKVATEALKDAVKNGTLKFAGGIAKGVGKGVAFEVPQEVAQQALERWQAGLSLSDDDAKSEYMQAAQGAAVLGGLLGGVESVVETGPAAVKARRQVKEDASEFSKLEELADAKRNAKPAVSQEAPAIEPEPAAATAAEPIVAPEAPDLTPQAGNVEGAGVAGDNLAGRGNGVSDVSGDVESVGGDATGSAGAIDRGGMGNAVSPVEPVNEGAGASYDPVKNFPNILTLNKAVEEAPSIYPKSAIARKFFINAVKDAIGQSSGVDAAALKGVRKDAYDAGTKYAANTLAELKNGLAEATPPAAEKPAPDAATEEEARLKRIQDAYAAAGKGQEFDPNTSLMDQMMLPATRGVRPAETNIEPTNITEEDVAPDEPSGPVRYADDLVSGEEPEDIYNAKAPLTEKRDTPYFIRTDYSDDVKAAMLQARQERQRGDNLKIEKKIPKGFTPEQVQERLEWAEKIRNAANAKLEELRASEARQETHYVRETPAQLTGSQINTKLQIQEAAASGALSKTAADKLIKRLYKGEHLTKEDIDAVLASSMLRIERSRFFDDLPRTPKWTTQELMKHVRDLNTALAYVTQNWTNAPAIHVVSEPKLTGPKLTLIENGREQNTRTELPGPVYERMKADERLNAPALTTENGTIYIIGSNIPKGYSHIVKPIIFHEAFHSGLVSPKTARKFQMEKDDLMMRIYSDNPKYRAKADAWLKKHPEVYHSSDLEDLTPHAVATEEVMAEEARTEAFRKTPTWQRIKDFIRRWARKLFQKNLPFSDRDVEAVIRMAVSNIESGKPATREQNLRILDKESVSVGSARYAPSKPKGPKKQTIQNRIDRARKKAAAMEDVISKSNPDETLDIAGEMLRTMRGDTKSLDKLKNLWGDMSTDRLRMLLPVLTTDDVTRMVGDKVNNIKPVNKSVNAMGAYRFNWRQDAAPLMEDWINYYRSNKNGAEELADTMHRARILQVNPSAHKDAATSIANDKAITKQKQIVAQNQGKTKTEAGKRGAAEKAIAERESDIKLMYEFWGKLDPKAKEIFARARDYYKKQFAEYKSLLQTEINKNAAAGSKDNVTKKLQDMFKEADELEVYFPLRRYGKYWYQYGTGEAREFYMFDSAHQRNTALRDRMEHAKKGGESRTAAKMIEDGDLDLGSSSRQAMAKEAGTNKVLQDLFKAIDSAGKLDKEEMKEQVFALYMNTLPNNSMRQNLRHAKIISGFSRDALRNYVTSVNTASNQMAKLKYASDIRNGLLAARSEIENHPDKEKLGTFIEEIGKRANLELSPNIAEEGEIDWNGLAAMGNQAVFYYMLTSPKSAVVQMTQLHIVGLPVLTAKYGFGKTMKMAAKYGNPLFSLGMVKDGKVVPPSISLSKAITEEKNSAKKAALTEGWEHANNLDKFMDTFVASTTERGKMPSAAHASLGQTALRRVANFMSGAFHHFERVSREIMYMSAFELEYDAQIEAGKSQKEATEIAKEVGIEKLEEALFNYSSYNKPRLAKSPIGKLGFQFMSYPMQMTSYIMRNGAALFRDLPAAEKKAAAIKLFGTIGMTAMYAGVVGLPGYSIIMGIADGMRDLFGDPGDDDEDNPLAAHNTDIWFRQYFIPTYFGAGVMGRAVTYGPVSALTGGDVSGSTSLDGLWIRNNDPPDSYKDGFQQMLLGLTGPFGSMGSQVAAGFDDINNGDLTRGMEKLSPAFLRNFIRTGRYATEGAVTKGNPGDIMKEKEWFTTGKLLGQSMGFAPMEIADIQQKTYALKREAEVIAKKQAKILDRVNRAFANDNDAEIDSALEAVDKYNDKYGEVLPITTNSLNSSIKNRLAIQAASIHGLRVNGKFRPAADELLGLSLGDDEE